MIDMSKLYLTPTNVTVGFYNLLDKKKYGEAFNCIGFELRNSDWKNDLLKFTSGYDPTVSIKDIACQVVEDDDRFARLDLSYTDKTTFLLHPSMNGLLNAEDRGSEEVVCKITTIQEIVADRRLADQQTIDNTPVDNLFMVNGLEAYMYALDVPFNKALEVFKSEVRTVHINKKIQCLNSVKGWRISSFRADSL
jgi:hypothetical protein